MLRKCLLGYSSSSTFKISSKLQFKYSMSLQFMTLIYYLRLEFSCMIGICCVDPFHGICCNSWRVDPCHRDLALVGIHLLQSHPLLDPKE